MKNSKVLKTILLISGLMLTVFGAGILLMPVEMAALNGIELGGQTSLLSETRAPGGSLLASGILVMSGAFLPKLTFTSVVVSALIYLSYGLSRILSMAIDGLPAEGLVQVAVLEIVTGLVCVFALVKYRENEYENERGCLVGQDVKHGSMTAFDRLMPFKLSILPPRE